MAFRDSITIAKSLPFRARRQLTGRGIWKCLEGYAFPRPTVQGSSPGEGSSPTALSKKERGGRENRGPAHDYPETPTGRLRHDFVPTPPKKQILFTQLPLVFISKVVRFVSWNLVWFNLEKQYKHCLVGIQCTYCIQRQPNYNLHLPATTPY